MLPALEIGLIEAALPGWKGAYNAYDRHYSARRGSVEVHGEAGGNAQQVIRRVHRLLDGTELPREETEERRKQRGP